MKVTIITVCYNSESTIRDTLESVFNQNYEDIEYIIIDGLSKDNTIKIIHEQGEKITHFTSEPDKGIYDAMNKGIDLANGDIIGILNSDDLYYDKEIISLIANIFQEDNNIDAVYGNLLYFETENPHKSVRYWKSISFYEDFFDDGFIIPHPTLFVRKSVYDNLGNYYPYFKISSDYEFMIRAFKVNKFIPFYLDKVIVKMRMGGESTKNWKNILIGNVEIYKAWKMNNLSVPFFFYVKRFIFKFKQLIYSEPFNNGK